MKRAAEMNPSKLSYSLLSPAIKGKRLPDQWIVEHSIAMFYLLLLDLVEKDTLIVLGSGSIGSTGGQQLGRRLP